jgi:hypothetical protein
MLTHLAERLTRTLSVARALIGSGRTVDLTGFEDGVGLLCAKTLDLSPDEARDVLPAMIELRAQIDRLTERIHHQRRTDIAAVPEDGQHAPQPRTSRQRAH